MGTVVFLVGPKAVGKTYVGKLLKAELGIYHIDADPLILEWRAAGQTPHPVEGWNAPVQAEAERALARNQYVSLEATGAWQSDFLLVDNLEALGHQILRVRLLAPEDETIARMLARASPAPISLAEAIETFRNSLTNAELKNWDLVLDMTGEPHPDVVLRAFESLLKPH